jgi:hypothetical protein
MANGQTTRAAKERTRRQIASLIRELEKLHDLSAPAKAKEPRKHKQLELRIKKVSEMLATNPFVSCHVPFIHSLGK